MSVSCHNSLPFLEIGGGKAWIEVTPLQHKTHNKHSILHCSSVKNLANIGKVRVLKSLLAVNASLRIVHQQFLSLTHPSSSYRQQIQRQRIHSGNKRVERFGGVHGRVAVPLGVCVQLGHRRQRGGPQLLEDDVTLVSFVLSREDGSAVVELYSLLSTREGTRKDAAATPHIDARVVIAIAQENVRRTVPQRNHLTRVSEDERTDKNTLLHRNTRCTSQTKVSEFQLAVMVNQQILGLEVSMNHYSSTSPTCEECESDDTPASQEESGT